MTKSVIIDGVEYVPKVKSKAPLSIMELKAEGEPYYCCGTKFPGHFEYSMTVENVIGEKFTFTIPRGMFENLYKAVAYIDD